MRGRRLALLPVIAALIVTGSYLYTNLKQSTGAEPVDTANLPDAATQIDFWEDRIAQQPGITSYTYLAAAHLRSARITGDVTAYQRAEAALDEALAINPDYPDARFQMAGVRFALHDFDEARAIAEGLASERRPPTGTLLLLSDIYLALGEYDLADEAVRTEHEAAPGPATLSRMAILADVNGDSEQAARLMTKASESARFSGVALENRAWLEYQIGYLYLKSGEIDNALDWFDRSEELLPGYYFARAGRARALAASGDLDGAIAVYEELVAAVPQPEYLAALGDLYILRGDADLASAQYETVEFIADLGAGAYDRQYTMYLLNHDLRLEEALGRVRLDLELRQDTYAWDMLAWALYKNGRYDEAAEAANRALSRGTRDALLLYHAGMIQAALGNADVARLHLETALSINPSFDPLQAELAVETLAALE